MPRCSVRSSKSNSIPWPIRIGPEPSTSTFFCRLCLYRLILAAEYRNSNTECSPQTPPHRYPPSYMLPRCRCHSAYRESPVSVLPVRRAITLSGNSIRFASFNSSTVSGSLFKCLLHLHEDGQLIDEPLIDLCDVVNRHHRSMPRRSASAITQILRSSTTCSCFYQFLVGKLR